MLNDKTILQLVKLVGTKRPRDENGEKTLDENHYFKEDDKQIKSIIRKVAGKSNPNNDRKNRIANKKASLKFMRKL